MEGVTGRLIEDVSECQKVWEAGEIPILVDETGKVIKELRPDALIDAILAKRNLGTTREMAPLTVALGLDLKQEKMLILLSKHREDIISEE